MSLEMTRTEDLPPSLGPETCKIKKREIERQKENDTEKERVKIE